MLANPTDTEAEFIESVNRLNLCHVQSMEKAGKSMDPLEPGSCEAFNEHVRNVQATIIYTFQLTGLRAIRKSDPEEAAKLWLEMKKLCAEAMNVLRKYKDLYPACGTPALYDLTLAYWSEAEDRRQANLQDAEWKNKPIPEGLFPKQN